MVKSFFNNEVKSKILVTAILKQSKTSLFNRDDGIDKMGDILLYLYTSLFQLIAHTEKSYWDTVGYFTTANF